MTNSALYELLTRYPGFVVDFFLFASFSFFVGNVEKGLLVFAGRLCRATGKVSSRLGALNSCCMASATDGLGWDCCAWASGDLARRGEPIWEILSKQDPPPPNH